MGINGLLPALKPIAKQVHISKYRGQKAAVDGYSWLHKGAYCCAKELCEGQWTDKFVTYFMSRIQLLRSNGIGPLVVFDGGRLPIKGQEEQSRHRARQEARDKAAAHLAAGNATAAVECYQRCVDITPRMAKQVIEELKAHNISYIVAPYEADAQMAYLIKQNHVQLLITEDSDLLAYACARVLYKLDRSGTGEEVSISDLPNCSSLPLSSFTNDQFLQLCVMAGCDFLSQLPGIGLKKAHGLLRKYRTFTKVLKILRFNGTKVPAEYEVRFQMALWAFRHCRVYCPTAKALVHLAPLPAGGLGAADVDVPAAFQQLEQQQQHQRLDFLGPNLPQELAQGIAEGRLDPNSHKPFDLAAIFAGCRNPPQHILAQLHTATGAVPHLLAYHQSQQGGSSALAAASGGSRSGTAAAAVSGAGRSGSGRVGLSKKHAAQGQKKLSWQAVAALTDSKSATAGTTTARKKATLGIAKFFSAPRAAAKDAEECVVRHPEAKQPAPAADASMPAATAAPCAPSAANMQNSIKQALQALKQQQQQRQLQQQCEKQCLLSEIQAHEQQGNRLQDPAPCGEDASTHAAKRRRTQDASVQLEGVRATAAGVALATGAADGLSDLDLPSSLPCDHEKAAEVAGIGRMTAAAQANDQTMLSDLAGNIIVQSEAADRGDMTDQAGQLFAGDSIVPSACQQIGSLQANAFTAIDSAAAGACSDSMLGSSGFEQNGSLNPSMDSSTGVPAASGGRGAAVSALTALFRGTQQQLPKPRTAAQRLFTADADVGYLGDGDGLIRDPQQQQGQQQRNVLTLSSSCQSGGMLASGHCDSLPGFSGSANMLGSTGLNSQGLGASGCSDGLMQQQQHVELLNVNGVWLSGRTDNPCNTNHNSSSFLKSQFRTEEQQQLDEGEPEVVSPPRPHALALGGSSDQQTWKQLQQTLRAGGGLRAGLKRTVEPIQPGSSLQRLNTDLGIGTKRSRFIHQADSSPDQNICDNHNVGLGSGFSLSDAAVRDDLNPSKAGFAGAAAAAVDAGLSGSSDSLAIDRMMDNLSGPLDPRQQQQQVGLDDWCDVGLGTWQQQQLSEGEECIEIPDSEGEDDLDMQRAAAVASVKDPAANCIGQQADGQQAAGTGGSSTDGSSLDGINDENATPDIHSIAHIRKYAKLAAKVVNKVQQQQEVKQQTQQQLAQKRTPLSAANIAAVYGISSQQPDAEQRSLSRTSNQSFLRADRSLGGSQLRSKSSKTKQRRRSLAAEVAELRYDPCMFVPVQMSPDKAVGCTPAECKNSDQLDLGCVDKQMMTAGCAADTRDSSRTLFGIPAKSVMQDSSFKPRNRVQGMFAQAAKDTSGADAVAAAKPFKAPWLSQKKETDSSSKHQGDGLFGAFGGFACGSEARIDGKSSRRSIGMLGPR